MFNYLAWVMKINQTNVMFHSIFVLIYMLIYKLLEYKNQLWLHFPINLNFQPYQLNAEKGMDKNMGQILDLYIAISFLYRFVFSFLSSSRPLETLKLWFLPSRPLWGEGSQKETTFFGGAPPQTLVNQLWHTKVTGSWSARYCESGSCPALWKNHSVCLGRFNLNVQRLWWKYMLPRMFHKYNNCANDRPLHDTQQENIWSRVMWR